MDVPSDDLRLQDRNLHAFTAFVQFGPSVIARPQGKNRSLRAAPYYIRAEKKRNAGADGKRMAAIFRSNDRHGKSG
jgi:hypothetical protein